MAEFGTIMTVPGAPGLGLAATLKHPGAEPARH
jgi:hypothetical protein